MNPKLLNPLIHVGYRKTGSTWIRKHLFDHPDRGFFRLTCKPFSEEDKGVPPPKRFSRHFIYGPEGKYLTLNEFSPGKALKALEEYNLLDTGVPVLSHERLAGHPDTGGFDSECICIRLSQVFDSPKIFLVIREQKSLLAASYVHYLTEGGTLSLPDYIYQPGDERSPKFNKTYFEFHHLISKYYEVFGKKNVLVLPYEMFRDEPNQFFGRLRDFSGANIPNTLPVQEKVNPRHSTFLESKLRLLNMFTWKRGPHGNSQLYAGKLFHKLDHSLRKRLRNIIPDVLEKRAREQHKQIIEREIGDFYHESNIETSELIGIDLKKYNY